MERDLAEHRIALLAGLSGRVVEIGAGNGMNFSHYPATVEEVVALEPEPHLRAAAGRSARTAAVKVTVIDGVAAPLPLEPASFDAAVCCLVLCTVPDAQGALAELRRVLTRGGELRFLEHVRSDRPRKARIQASADRLGIWPLLGGGCHCSRDSAGAIAAAGFAIERTQRFDIGPSWGITNPHVRGVARSPL